MNKTNEIVKICVPCVGDNLEAEVDSRFGRARGFMLVEVKDGEIISFKLEKNIGAEQRGGAGVSAVEQISELGANVLIAREIGPKAQNILEQLDIEFINDYGTVKDVLSRYLRR